MKTPPDPAELVRRIWAKDASLWSDDPAVQATIRNRLGWLDLPERMRAEVVGIRAFADQVRKAGYRRALVLGMGGSSLCAEGRRRSATQNVGSRRAVNSAIDTPCCSTHV